MPTPENIEESIRQYLGTDVFKYRSSNCRRWPEYIGKISGTAYAGKNYKYRATIEKVGRSAAGNEALAMATGEYLNFLDDDDMFMEKHVETLVSKLAESSDLAAYSVAEERQLRTDSADPTAYKIKRKTIRFQQPFNRLLLYTFNYFPIQSVMLSLIHI